MSDVWGVVDDDRVRLRLLNRRHRYEGNRDFLEGSVSDVQLYYPHDLRVTLTNREDLKVS